MSEFTHRLTHQEEKNTYLTGIFRGLFLQYTTGEVKALPPKG